MRAVVCDRLGDPSVLKIEERPVPQPGPADVLIKVGAASVMARRRSSFTGATISM